MKNIWLKFYTFINSWVGTIIIVLGFIFFIAQAFMIPSGSMLNSMLIGDNLLVKKFSYGIPIPTIPFLEFQILPDFNKNGHLIEGDRPQRGDIVIFRYPKAPKIYYVKRNVAIHGDALLYTKDGLWVHFGSASKYQNTESKTLIFRGKTFYYEPYQKFHPGVHYEEVALDAFMQLQILAHNKEEIAMQEVHLSNGESAFYTEVEEDTFFMMGDNRNNSNDSRFWGAVPYKYVIGKPWFIYFSWDDMYNVRWERIGRSIESLEQKELQKKQND